MKKLIFILFTFLSLSTSAQTFTSYDLNSHGCSTVSPPYADTLTYNFKSDTLNVSVIKWGHCCPKPSTSMQLIADTIQIDIQDTSTVFCTCDCSYEYNFSLYGFSGNIYIAQVFGKDYTIDRSISSVQPHTQKPVFERKGNIFHVNRSGMDFKVKIYDLKGSLLQTLTKHTIDINALNLNTGIYFFQLQLNNKEYTEKVLIE